MPSFRFPFKRDDELRRDIDDELEHHLALATAALEREGLPPAEARAEALARLGDGEALRRRLHGIDRRTVRRDRMLTWLRECRADLAFAFRRMRRRPLLATATVCTLAVGIGTAMTFVGAADAILLRPLPIDDPDRVLTLWRAPVRDAAARTGLGPGTIADLLEEARSFESLAAAEPYSFDIEREGEPLSVGAWLTTDGFFDILRTRPALGRLLDAADHRPGADPVIVVSHAFWQRHLRSRPEAIGTLERLDGTPYRVVGVLPPDFPYAEGRQLYVPRIITGAAREDRTSDYWLTYARLRADLSVEAARDELAALARRSDARARAVESERALVVLPLADVLLGEVRTGLLLLALGALLLLLMAATNTSGLLLADTMGRARELALRASLGAGRERIVRQLLSESTLLAALATALGLGLGIVGLRLFREWVPATMPRLAELSVDPRLLGLTFALSLAVAAFVGIAPARIVRTTDLQSVLKGGRDAGSSRGRRFRSALVGTQVALAVLLLCTGGLLVRSWIHLTSTDQGYATGGVVALETHVWGSYRGAAAREAFGRAITEQLAGQPGVRAAAVGSDLPLADAIGDERARVRRLEMTEAMSLHGVVASPGFFDALSIDVTAGRAFGAEDGTAGEPVVMLSETAAARLFPAGDAIGAQLLVTGSFGAEAMRRVVGIVRDVRFASLEEAGPPTVYLPFAQAPTGSIFLIARYEGEAAAQVTATQRAARALLPNVALNDVVLLDELRYQASVPRRFTLLLLTSFSAIALLLTAVGVFGLLAQVVQLRERELGVRLALGAWPTQLRTMMLREGLRLTGGGIAIGLVAFMLASGVLRGLLFGVPTRDPATLVGVSTLMLAVAAAASWWPATLATRVDPLRALRAD